jgi:hypothetical protein
VIVVYRSRKKATVGSTKSDRFRSVEIGPRTSLALRTQSARRREFDTGFADNALVFVRPVRGRKRSQARRQTAGFAEAMATYRATGTRRRSRMRRCATCPSTPCVIPPRHRGWRRATRSCTCSASPDTMRVILSSVANADVFATGDSGGEAYTAGCSESAGLDERGVDEAGVEQDSRAAVEVDYCGGGE